MLGKVSIRTNRVANSVVIGESKVMVCASPALTGGILFLADRGFAFSDEAFYLLKLKLLILFALPSTV